VEGVKNNNEGTFRCKILLSQYLIGEERLIKLTQQSLKKHIYYDNYLLTIKFILNKEVLNFILILHGPSNRIKLTV
jgi:hypothetical protein